MSILTDDDKKQLIEYLLEHAPKDAMIVVTILTEEGAITFTNITFTKTEFPCE